MNKTQSPLIVEYEQVADLTLLPSELKMVFEILPELIKDMLWLLDDSE